MELDVAKEPKAEEGRLEEALSVANTEFIDKDSPGGEPAKLNQEGARVYVSVGRADSPQGKGAVRVSGESSWPVGLPMHSVSRQPEEAGPASQAPRS